MGFFTFVLLIVALVTFGEVVTKLLDRGPRPPAVPPANDAELGRLREQVELLAAEVDRLSEEQRFLTRLLEARPESKAMPEQRRTEESS